MEDTAVKGPSRMLTITLIVVAVALLGYASVAGYLWRAQDSYVFVPSPKVMADPVAEGYRYFTKEVLTTPTGARLSFWNAPPMPGKPVIVFFHGNAGTAEGAARYFLRFAGEGYGVLLAEYPGYSGNHGTPSQSSLYAAGDAYATWAAAHWSDSPIVVWGESLGTAVAIDIASKRSVSGLILDAPFTSITDIAKGSFPFMPVKTLLRNPFENMKKMGSVTAPVLVIHGEDDSLVPPEMGRKILAGAGCPGTGLFLPGVAHPAFASDRSGKALAAVEAFLAAAVPVNPTGVQPGCGAAP